jgi:sigma-B regulation protein RsbU (phosphoserine phosphatase)
VFDCRLLEYSIGGHPFPILINDNKTQALETTDGIPLGIDPATQYLSKKIQLTENDCLFTHTDGVTEARNKHRDFFGEERMVSSLKEAESAEPKELINTLLKKLKQFTKLEEQADDITMLAIKWKK